MSTSTIPLILYVDDDADDYFFFQESLSRSGYHASLIGASNGEEAINYLHSIESVDQLPSLIILDLNMPRWDGRQTLRYLKEHPPLNEIPVVILSTSENIADKEICAGLGAVSYVQKPSHFEGYREIIDSCVGFMEHA